jgi:glutaredoxin
MQHTVKVYGPARCPRTIRATALLQDMGVRYDYFDLDVDRHAAAWVRWKSPDAPTPTVLVGLAVLAGPSDAQLRAAVADEAQGRRPTPAHAMN